MPYSSPADEAGEALVQKRNHAAYNGVPDCHISSQSESFEPFAAWTPARLPKGQKADFERAAERQVCSSH